MNRAPYTLEHRKDGYRYIWLVRKTINHKSKRKGKKIIMTLSQKISLNSMRDFLLRPGLENVFGKCVLEEIT